ncbi:MAG: NADH-quinone oxidoreductase subunit I [Deltaproteobacteria bacterium]|nr:NADH-quinone oxidoreductase subunit I [Deltaproteobacteria bacterium]
MDQVHVPTNALLKKVAARRPWWVNVYIPALVRGLTVSIKQFFKKSVTIQYPEQKAVINERFRGEHYLKRDEHEHMKCVACYMCATACPANCIHIEAEPAPQGPGWEGRDKVPAVFEIDMLKCIYCGYCVEACPKDAIAMTNKIPKVYTDRKDFIYGMQKLLYNDQPDPPAPKK